MPRLFYAGLAALLLWVKRLLLGIADGIHHDARWAQGKAGRKVTEE